MKYKFVAFHTMTRGAGKPGYVVNCAKALADAGVNVLVLDAVMYEQGAIAHQFFEILGATPVIEDGKNLYDLIHDYEALCLDSGAPPFEAEPLPLANHLEYPESSCFRGYRYPDVCSRTTRLPDLPLISFLPGNNGRVVEVRERIDFQESHESRYGQQFFEYVKAALSERFDVVLINAPAGHQEISGILCGQIADLILAIDLDSPVLEPDASFEACRQLAQRVHKEGWRRIEVKSVKGHSLSEVVKMILQEDDGL